MTHQATGFDLQRSLAQVGFSLVESTGAGRFRFNGAKKISEAFDSSNSPNPGSVVGMIHAESEDQAQDQLVGLGIAGSIRGIAAGTVAVTITPLRALASPVNISELAEALGEWTLPRRLFAAPLTVEQSLALMDFLTAREPWVASWIERQLSSPRTYEPGIEQARVEARDAVGLAASIAEVDLPANALSPDPLAKSDEGLLDTILSTAHSADLEEELLPLDMVRWDGEVKVEQAAASMALFTDPVKSVRLAVFSVNKKPLELELGVDLFYWDKILDLYTFVQYKRLEKVKESGDFSSEWVYKRKSEIQDQLDLMPTAKRDATVSADWRMTDTPFWFKFVRGDAGCNPDRKVLKGMYVPADLLRLAIVDNALNTGPRGGFRVTYQNIKYLVRKTFVQLVSRGLVGTTTRQSAIFRPILASLGGDRQLIIAVKDEWNREEDIPQGSDSWEDSPF